MLSVAPRHADLVGVNFTIKGGALGTNLASGTAEAMRERVGWVREAAGTRFPELELNLTSQAVVTDDRAAVAARFAGRFGLPIDEAPASPLILVGSVEQIGEDLQARREAYGFSYIVFTGHEAALAPLVARLSGT